MPKAKTSTERFLEFSLENHLIEVSKKSKIIYHTIIFTIILCLIILPFVKVQLSIPYKGIIRAKQEYNNIISGVDGMVQFSNIFENKTVKTGDTLLSVKNDDLNALILNQKLKIKRKTVRRG